MPETVRVPAFPNSDVDDALLFDVPYAVELDVRGMPELPVVVLFSEAVGASASRAVRMAFSDLPEMPMQVRVWRAHLFAAPADTQLMVSHTGIFPCAELRMALSVEFVLLSRIPTLEVDSHTRAEFCAYPDVAETMQHALVEAFDKMQTELAFRLRDHVLCHRPREQAERCRGAMQSR